MRAWTTPAQHSWLQERLPQWVKDFRKKKASKWLLETTAHFFSEFSIPESERVLYRAVSRSFHFFWSSCGQLCYRGLGSGFITAGSRLSPGGPLLHASTSLPNPSGKLSPSQHLTHTLASSASGIQPSIMNSLELGGFGFLAMKLLSKTTNTSCLPSITQSCLSARSSRPYSRKKLVHLQRRNKVPSRSISTPVLKKRMNSVNVRGRH